MTGYESDSQPETPRATRPGQKQNNDCEHVDHPVNQICTVQQVDLNSWARLKQNLLAEWSAKMDGSRLMSDGVKQFHVEMSEFSKHRISVSHISNTSADLQDKNPDHIFKPSLSRPMLPLKAEVAVFNAAPAPPAAP